MTTQKTPTTHKPRLVKGLSDLKGILAEDQARGEFYIMLGGGLKSSKVVKHFPGDPDELWYVYHSIDGSDQVFATDEAMLSGTKIGEALEKNALMWYGW